MQIKSFKDFLNEGGKVFKLETRRVSATEAADTINYLYKGLLKKLGLEEGKNIQAVGSGSIVISDKTDAGDIDFIYDLPDMRKRLGAESCEHRFFDRVRMELTDIKTEFIKGFGITSVEYPVAGEKDKGYVQVDFIPVENMNWSRFAYTQSSKSKYKSAHRNWLFSAMCSVKKTDVRKVDGNILSWSSYMFDIQRGFFKVEKSLEGVNGNLIKNPKKVGSELVTMDPDKFLSIMFDGSIHQEQVESFEQCWKYVSIDEKWKDKIDELAKELDKFLRRANLDIPNEIQEYL